MGTAPLQGKEASLAEIPVSSHGPPGTPVGPGAGASLFLAGLVCVPLLLRRSPTADSGPQLTCKRCQLLALPSANKYPNGPGVLSSCHSADIEQPLAAEQNS